MHAHDALYTSNWFLHFRVYELSHIQCIYENIVSKIKLVGNNILYNAWLTCIDRLWCDNQIWEDRTNNWLKEK